MYDTEQTASLLYDEYYTTMVNAMSSLIFLGFSVIMFVISYGIMFTLVPMILGAFFSVSNSMPISDSSWAQTYEETEEVIRWLVPLVPTIGIFIFIIKVLMVASVRGRE